MGNFSRNTFHAEKNYVGVRLQQGVPLVDADWNEQNDVGRQELYNGLSTAFEDGVGRYSADSTAFAFWVYPSGLTNDFYILGGSAIVGGRPVQTPAVFSRYSLQPWTDATKAANDGVAVIAPLTTPAAARDDLAYLDVWEREVGQAEDSEIVNPLIGVETAVRIKREACVRVAEGTTTLPAAPAGHQFMPLAVLHRPAGGAVIQNAEAEDLRRVIDGGPALHTRTVLPVYQPINLGGWPVWLNEWTYPKLYAHKSTAANAFGCIPLTLPDRANLASYQLRGRTTGTMGEFFHAFVRSRAHSTTATPPAWLLASEYYTAIGSFSRSLTIAPQAENLHIVDNGNYAYYLVAWASGSSLDVVIDGATITYYA